MRGVRFEDSPDRERKDGGGIGASPANERIAEWGSEHKKLLSDIAPAGFDIPHYAVIALLKKKNL